jgi:Mg2+ and Co2+ transporter CorA
VNSARTFFARRTHFHLLYSNFTTAQTIKSTVHILPDKRTLRSTRRPRLESNARMSSSFLAAKNNPVQISKLFKENAEEEDQEILSMLNDIHDDLSEMAISPDPKSNNSYEDLLNLSRKIMFSTQSQLQTDKLARAGTLYQADQALSNEVSTILTNDDTKPSYHKRLMKSALREKLLE